MKGVPLVGQRNGRVSSKAKSGAALDSQSVVPENTDLGTLSGHGKPASRRNNLPGASKSPSLLKQIFRSARRPSSIFDFSKFSMFSRRPKQRYYYDPATDTYRPLAFGPRPSVRQTCRSCGKFRSPTWQASHPLAAGASPSSSICKKCRGKYTSSAESVSRHGSRRRGRHHAHHHSHHYSHRRTDSTDDSYISREHVKTARRYRSRSRDYIRPRTTRSHSRDGVRIIIANRSGPCVGSEHIGSEHVGSEHVGSEHVGSERVIPKREITTSSSADFVRIIHRTEIFEVPRRSRSRSALRSSGVPYVEDGKRYIEDLAPPQSYPKPKILSRSDVDNYSAPRYRSRARSPSHVTFVEETDEPVVIRPRSRLSRRRAIYFDGAVDSDRPREEVRGRTQLSDRLPTKISEDKGNAEPMDKSVMSRARSFVQKEKGPDSEAKPVAETVLPHYPTPSHSAPAKIESSFPKWQQDRSTADTPSWSNSYHKPTAETAYDSDYNKETSPKSPFAGTHVAVDDDRRSATYSQPYDKSANIHPHRSSLTPSLESGTSSQEQYSEEPETPRHDRRRRFRGTDSDSDMDDEATPERSPRYHGAPSPPSPLQSPDVLGEMFESFHITPLKEHLGYDYADGRPTKRADRREGSPLWFGNTFNHPDHQENVAWGENVSGSHIFGAADDGEAQPQTDHEEVEEEPWMEYATQAAQDYDWTT